MERRFLHSALRELHVFARAPRFWLTFLTVVAIFWVTGPYETGERLAAAPRLGYWLVLHALAWATAIIFVVAAEIALRARMASMFLRMLTGAALAAPVIGLVTLTLNSATFGRPFTAAAYGESVLIGMALSVLFCILTWHVMRGENGLIPDEAGQAAEATPAAAHEVPLLRRLQPKNRGRLRYLSMQDHYVEVATIAGKELLLMRFSDALEELGNAPGLRVHRSHWIADDAVTNVVHRNGKMEIVVASGTRFPVSRPYRAAARNRWAAARKAQGSLAQGE